MLQCWNIGRDISLRLSERVICECGNDELGPTDYDIIDGKVQCWRCRWYDYKKGKYIPKNIYGKKVGYFPK